MNPRNSTDAWTDLVYEQIITKRLTAVVEKNEEIRAHIMAKAAETQETKNQEETNYEKKYGKTVSKEEMYVPPAAKEKLKEPVEKKPKSKRK